MIGHAIASACEGFLPKGRHAAVFLFIGYVFNVMTMRTGEIGFVAPFRYTILIWATGLGILVFGDPMESRTVVNPVSSGAAAGQ